MPPNLRRSPASPCTNRSNTRSRSSFSMPIPSSCTSTTIISPSLRASTVTTPPSGEYLIAFSRSCPTMMSVAIGSPYACGNSSGTSISSLCRSDNDLNATAVRLSSPATSKGPLLTCNCSAPARDPSRSCSTRRASDPARSAIVCTADRRTQLMTGCRQEKILSVLELLGCRNVTEVQHLLVASLDSGAQYVDPAAVLQAVGELGARLGKRERRPSAGGKLRRYACQPMGSRVPLADQPIGVEHGDAVGAGVDHRALVGTLPHNFLEGRDVREGHAGMPSQKLKQLELNMPYTAPAVERVERAVRASSHMRKAQRDRVQPGQCGPDQVVEPARVAGCHQYRLARPHELPDHAGLQVRSAASQLGGQAIQTDQAQPVVLYQHEPAGVRPRELAQACSDPVEHRLKVKLGVDVRDDVTQPAHNPSALSHVVPHRLVVAVVMAYAHPAGQFPGAVEHPAGVDPHIDHRAISARPAGRERDLTAASHSLQDGVMFCEQFSGHKRRLQANNFFGAPAKQPLGGRIPDVDAAIGTDRDDRIGGTLKHGPRHGVDAIAIWLRDRKLPTHRLMVALACGSRSANEAKVQLACHGPGQPRTRWRGTGTNERRRTSKWLWRRNIPLRGDGPAIWRSCRWHWLLVHCLPLAVGVPLLPDRQAQARSGLPALRAQPRTRQPPRRSRSR